jgi:dTDP-4-dehydrorhamnose reductase
MQGGPILVLGAHGLVGTELAELLAARGTPFVLRSHAECDITDVSQVRAAVTASSAALVINCAAYNAVDRAEDEPDLALRVNGAGAGHVAGAAPALVHYSTDFVFDGTSERPYVETDPPAPLSAYARAKAAGDAAVQAGNPRHFLLRVGCLYGKAGKGFGSTLMARLRRGERVLADAERRIQPTWSRQVATQTLAVMDRGQYGLFHAMAHGETNWADFAREAARLAGYDAGLVEGVATATIPAKARRPPRSVLANQALTRLGIDHMADWRDGLIGYLEEGGHV